jgi:hypothetical protein
VAVDDDRVPAIRELQGGAGDCAAKYMVLVCRVRKPRLDPTIHDERHEGVHLDVRAQVEGGGNEPAHRGFSSARRPGDDEDGSGWVAHRPIVAASRTSSQPGGRMKSHSLR